VGPAGVNDENAVDEQSTAVVGTELEGVRPIAGDSEKARHAGAELAQAEWMPVEAGRGAELDVR
jgi:hypothetical protein